MASEQPKPEAAPSGIRIAKAMADAGLCSRREAERWITAGRVTVNGKKLDTPALTVTPSDKIVVDGQPLPSAQAVRMWRYHKPRGLVTTHADPEGRTTVFEQLPKSMPRVISIGRLDYNTEGLLLLTTNGQLARHLELPSTAWRRNYRVRAKGTVTQAQLDTLKKGVKIDGVSYGGITAHLDERSAKQQSGANIWLSLTLREGKNREVRLVLASLGLTVSRLIRVSYGPFSLGDLPAGQCEEVDINIVADQIGPRMSQSVGLSAPPKPGTIKPKSKAKAPRNPSGNKKPLTAHKPSPKKKAPARPSKPPRAKPRGKTS